MEKKIIEWNSDLSVGNKVLDSEHKALFDKINELYYGFEKGKNKDLIVKMLVFLNRYINEHFTDEEEYMRENKFPDLVIHKRIHQEFMKRYKEFEEEYSSGKSINKMAEEVKTFLADWWINHVAIVDRQYAEYVSKNK